MSSPAPDAPHDAASGHLDRYMQEGWSLHIRETDVWERYPWTITLAASPTSSSVTCYGATYAEAIEETARMFGARW